MAESHVTALFAASFQRLDSTVAAKNFLTLFNPVGSGRSMTVGALFVSYMTTVASPLYPMRGYRVSAAPSGGTLATTADICRFDTQRFAPEAVVRSNGVTATPEAALFNVTPGLIQGQNQSSAVEQVDSPAGFNPFVLYPGEGLVVRQDAGAVGHLWNLTILWREVRR